MFHRFSSLLVSALLLLLPLPCGAVGDASTSFQIFVPANNDPVGRDSALIVTNVSPTTSVVNIIDDGADGDTDDSRTSVSLATGQSQVVFIKDGATNDDAGGRWDGDYFRITATEPVVSQIATRSDWQWDFVPADNKTMRGQSFFIYSPSTSFSDRDLNVFSYEPDTEVSLLRISPSALNGTGVTTVDLSQPVEILKATLQAGEDLIVTRNLGVDVLKPGQTYWVRATRPITCMSGSLVGNARDGMAFVPSSNGSSSGEQFTFSIPSDFTGERELRLIAWENGTTAQFDGWNPATRVWTPIQTFQLNASGRADWVESGNGNLRLFRITSNSGRPVSVLIQSWMETGGINGTKDDTSFASAKSGFGAGRQFLFYLPPPGEQGRVLGFNSLQSHVFLYGHVNGTRWTVRDSDTSGGVFLRSGVLNKGEFARVSVSSAIYSAMNRPAEGRRPYLSVEASQFITCQASNFNDNWMTFVPSVTLPNPVLTATSLDQRVAISQPARFRFDATNAGASALNNAELVVSLDAAVQFSSIQANGLSLGTPSITTETATGRQILRWPGLTIPEGATVGAEITVVARARRVNGTRVRNGDFVLHTVTVRGVGFGAPAAQGGESEVFTGQASAASTVLDPNQTALNFFSAQTSGTGVAVRWQTVTEPDVDLFRVFRATSASGPYSLITGGTVPGVGDAGSGSTYSVLDRTVSGSSTWYYRLDLVDSENAVRSVGPVAVSTLDTIPPDQPSITSAVPSNGRVDLTFTGGNRDGDLRAYELFRSTSLGGPFAAVGAPSASTTFPDSSVLNGMTYYYRVQAVDTTGNRSSLSSVFRADTPSSVTESWTVGYEDQLGPSANDWDYNDFVVLQKSDETFEAGGLRSLAIRLEAGARGASFSNQFWQQIRVQGAWTATVELYTNREATAPFSTQNFSGSGPARLLIWNQTRDALPPFEDTNFTNTASRQTTPTLGQVARIQLSLTSPQLNPSDRRHRAPYDPFLKSNLGEIHLVRENYPQSTEVVAFDKNRNSPLYGFNADYVLAVPTEQWFWLIESRRIWNAYPRFAAYLLSGRASNLDWWIAGARNSSETWNNYVYSSARQQVKGAASRLASLPSTGLEIVDEMSTTVVGPVGVMAEVGSSFEWARGIVWGGGEEVRVRDGVGAVTSLTLNSARSRPLIVPLVPGSPSVLITAEERYETQAHLEVREWPSGELRWRVPTQGSVKSALVAVALDGPDAPKTILAVTDESRLYALTPDGQPRFPALQLGESQFPAKNVLATATPVVADMDGNGTVEILVAMPSGQVAVLSSTGQVLPGWPTKASGSVVASPIVLRDPGSGQARIQVASIAGQVQQWNLQGQVTAGFPIQWESAIVSSPARLTEDTAIWATADGQLRSLDTRGGNGTGWQARLDGAIRATPVLADLDGDGATDVLAVSETGQIGAWNRVGKPLEGFPIQAGGAIQGSPLVADIDLDGRMEVWMATATGQLLRWNCPTATPLGFDQRSPWPSVGGSLTGSPLGPPLFTTITPGASVADWTSY